MIKSYSLIHEPRKGQIPKFSRTLAALARSAEVTFILHYPGQLGAAIFI